MSKESLKEQANKLYKKGDYSIACKLYLKHVSEPHDDNKNAYSNLSLCYFKMEKFKDCIEACNQALKIDPNYSKCLYRKTLAYK